MNTLLQSLRMTWRDWRAGELRFLLVAIVIAVGALSSVGFFVDRVSHALQRDANQFLGADLVLTSDEPIANQLREQTQDLQRAETTSFVSMVMNDAQSDDDILTKLVSVKAVSDGYPLRGAVTLETGEVQNRIPAPGTVWVEQAVLTVLKIKIGQQLQLGDKLFTVSHVIQNEPDRGSAYLNFAPRVMLAETDLAATNLVQPSSKVTYRLLLSGTTEQIAEAQELFESKISTHQLKGFTLESLKNSRPEMSSTLDKAKQFLSLVSLLSAMLAALAIALAARRFMLRHIDSCAMLRCLGLTQTQVTVLYLIEFIVLGILASLLGAALGYFGHLALLVWLGSFISGTLPAPTGLPALQGIAIGMLLLIGFAIPPVLQLRNVPHNLMVRHQTGAPNAHTIFAYLIGISMFAVLLFWQTGDIILASYTLSGFLVGCILFAGCAWIFLHSLQLARGWLRFSAWRFAITGLQRRPLASIVQVVSLGLGLMALLLLTIIRADLLAAWQQSTPVDAPNHFIINILPEQKEAVSHLLQQHHIENVVFYPMMRGRLISINGRSVSAKDYESENTKRLIEREFNLSTMKEMQSYNRLVAGEWFSGSAANPKPEASIEEGIAKSMHLKLGDKLRFDVGGGEIELNITSIRKLEWDTMQVNFFMIIDPQSAAGLPQTWITAFFLPPNNPILIHDLSRRFPNLTIVDTGAVLRQVQQMLNQVVAGVQFLFLFTLASGLLVLYAALQSSQQQRLQETSLLRALGASRNQLSRTHWIEYGLVGGLAGLLAASGAAIIGWILARQVFEFEFQPTLFLWVVGILTGALCSLIGGSIGLQHILRQPPLLSLREG